MSAKGHTAIANKGIITACAMMATIMQVLDTTIANVALPHMQGALSATQDQITWVLTSYIVAAAVMTLPVGWLTGKYGSKSVFLVSIFGFTFTSLLCGLAVSLEQMVLFRLLQGVFGAALVPLSQATMLDINPKENHGKAMAIWGMGVMVGPILGPTLGGILTEYYSWRWVFYINLPIGILSFFGIAFFMHETERQTRPFDIRGFAFLALAIGGIQMMLDRGEQVDWFESYEIWCYLMTVISCFWMYYFHVKIERHPFISPALFLDVTYSVSIIFIFFVGVILLATMALLPPFLQNQMGYPVLDTGFLMAPRGIGTLVATMIVSKISDKLDIRYLLALGLLLIAASLFWMTTFTVFVPEHLLVSSAFVQGLGLGFIFIPLSAVAFSTLEQKYRAEAAALFSLVRNIGSSIGVSVVTYLLKKNIQINHSYMAESYNPNTTDYTAGYLPHSVAKNSLQAMEMVNKQINDQAAAISYVNDFYLMMWIVLAIIPLVWFIRPTKKANP